jgi:hypothetical protein
VNIVDNIIRLNNGAAFSSSLQAGIEVNRGAGYSNYYFIFDENSDYFKIGMSGGLQTVATRDDTVGSNSIAFYDAGGYKYTGCNDLVYSDGHLGVGISNPSYRLHVNTGAMIQGAFANTSYAAHGRMYFNDRNYGIGAGTFTGSTYDHLYMWRFDGVNRSIVFCRTSNGNTNPSTYIVDMIIYGNTGNVGIGLSNPAYKLDVVGDINYTGNLRQNGNLFTGSQWATNSSNLYILSSNVGIGTSNPAYKLDVVGDINYTGNLRQNGNIFTGSQWATNSSNLYILSSNVGIGLSNPAYTLDVNGNSRLGYTYHLHSNLPYGTSTTNRRYALIASLLTNNGFANFKGWCTGHNVVEATQGQSSFDLIINGRGWFIKGNCHNTANVLAGLVVYLNSSTNTLDVYLTGGNWFRYVIGIQGEGLTVPSTITWSTDTAWATPANSTLIFDTVTNIPINSQDTSFYMTTALTPIFTTTRMISGNVGIGNSNPTEVLEVTGKIYASTQILGQSNDSVTIPSFAFKQDSNTGIYHPAASTLGFVTGGTERMRIDSSGNIGIGNSNISGSRLYVAGNTTLHVAQIGTYISDVNYAMFAHSNSTASSAYCLLHQNTGETYLNAASGYPIRFRISNVDRAILDSSGNFGIGTTTPSGYKLDVAGPTRIQNILTMNSQVQNCVISLWGSNVASGTFFYGFGVNSFTFRYQVPAASDSHVFYQGNVELMRIKGDGKVGIGTTAPSNTLDIVGSMRISSNITTPGSLLFTNSSGSSAFGIRPDSAVYLSAVAPYMASSSDNTALPATGSNARPLYLYGSNITYDARFGNHNFNVGNVGINAPNPMFRLHTGLGSVFIGDSNYVSTTIPATVANTTTANGYRLIFDNSFNGTAGTGMAANKIVLHNNNWLAGFGIENSAVTYHSGSAHNFYVSACNTNTYGNIGMALSPAGLGIGTTTPSYKLHVVGDVYATADVIAYSDCNIKTDLQRIENAMEKLECINGYTYKRKDIDDSRRYAGLIAQEVEKVLPEVVHKDLDNRLSIAYGNMSSLIIEAIKELRGEVLAIKRHIGLL